MDELLDFLRLNAALMVSALALLLTVCSGIATRKHNRLMVQPRLSTFTQTSPVPGGQLTAYKATLSNSGLGPAIIKKFEVLLDGKAVEAKEPTDLYGALSQAVAARFVPNLCYFALLRKDHVMAKDEEVEVAKVTIQEATPEQFEAMKRFHLRITYESAYGESFAYDTRTHTAEPQRLTWFKRLWGSITPSRFS